ncbi:MAG: hypothetical protein NXY57DRAFT_710851 [Lentinula lateritia]|nr:MAG: hypothetical protein NXY57DRAFT_710851 [Lentinula lateritia]
MSCLEIAYSSISLSGYHSQHHIEPRTKISIFSLLNPEPIQIFPEVDIPSTVSQTPSPVPSYRDCRVLDLSGYERKDHARRISKSYRKSPYPTQHQRARRSRRTSACLDRGTNIIAGKRLGESSKGVWITLDTHLSNPDLEREARQCRAEWRKDQANRVEAPRPAHHSQPEIKALALWLADVLCDTFLDEQTESGTRLLKELGAEIKSLLSSCINPSTSTLFLALFYMRKLFSDHLHLRGYSALHCAQVLFRAFCLALMLAFKWLDDYTHSVRSNVAETDEEFWKQKRANPKKYRTCWADFMSMSVSEVKSTEVCALTLLDWNISVSTSDWFFWLEDLRIHTIAPSGRSICPIVAALIYTAQLEVQSKSPDAPFLNPSPQISPTRSLEPLRRLESALLVGISTGSWTVPPDVALEESPVGITHSETCPTVAVNSALVQIYPWQTYHSSALENCFPPSQLSQNPYCCPTDLNYILPSAQNSMLPSYNSTSTPIFLDPWRVYDFKSSVYL